MEQATPLLSDQNEPDPCDLGTLAAVIARSPIYLREPKSHLPAGFDAVDVAILDWIATQARATRRAYLQM